MIDLTSDSEPPQPAASMAAEVAPEPPAAAPANNHAPGQLCRPPLQSGL